MFEWILKWHWWDPNGYIRHFVIGMFICIFPRAFWIALIIAICKECYDSVGHFMDIVFTVLPAVFKFLFRNIEKDLPGAEDLLL